jgi:endonuclease/exonuclease/phosphatase family metal-dependent hydrolase
MFTNKYLHIKVPKVVKNTPTVICGDFNSYHTEGTTLVDDLKQSFVEASGHITKTFTCFPHSKYQGQMYSDKLDHVFTYPSDISFLEDVSVYDTSIEMESDHCLMIITTRL